MVQAIINLNEHQNRILTIIKGKYGLRNKSEAINIVLEKFEENFIEPELKPEYIKKIRNIEKRGKFIEYKSVSALRKAIENA